MRATMAIVMALATGALAAPVLAEIAPRPGWQVIGTDMPHAVLLERLLAAVP